MGKPAARGAQGSPSLALQTYTELVALITSGRILSGERIVIGRLAEQLGVSQTSVRAALARLAQEGLVDTAPGGHLQVVELTPQFVHDVYHVRGALEGLCVELATPYIRLADLARVRRLMDETAAAIARGDQRPYTRSDVSLHQLVIAATTNRILVRELQTLQPLIELIRHAAQRTSGADLLSSHQEHVQIVSAIADRDSTRARYAMEQHIRTTGERIARLISES